MLPSHVSAPKTGDEAPKIRLYLRDPNGDENYQYPPEGEWVSCAVKVVSVCRAMLKAEIVGHTLRDATKMYGDYRSDARFHDLVLITEQTEKFISSFCQDFPRLCVDYSITNCLVLRPHVKGSGAAEFKPEDHSIYLNGKVIGTRDTLDNNISKHTNTTLEFQKYVQRSDQIKVQFRFPELVVPFCKLSLP